LIKPEKISVSADFLPGFSCFVSLTVFWLISVSEYLKPPQSVLPLSCLRTLSFLRADILISTLKVGIKKPGAGAAGQILSYNLETED